MTTNACRANEPCLYRHLLSGFILCLDDVVGVAGEFLQEFIGGGVRVYAEPMLLRHVKGFANAVVAGPKLVDAVGWHLSVMTLKSSQSKNENM